MLVHLFACLKQNVQAWRVMILPWKAGYLSMKFGGVIGSATHVEDLIVFAMFLFQEVSDL